MRRALVPAGLLVVALLIWWGFIEPNSDPRMQNTFRHQENGWVLVHLEGTPGQIGYQNGSMLSGEIAEGLEVQKLELTHDGKHPWAFYRKAAKDVLWPHVETEYREELQGIADGLNAHGKKYDVWDVVALNAASEWSYYTHGVAGDHCSAFVATGSYTKDKHVILAHNNWTTYMDGERWNIVYDIVPKSGYRFIMDGYPGFIHSGDDFGVNAAGLAIAETTISGFFGFDVNGIPEFVRARKAMQYAKNIDDFARIMKDGNNGGYANDWLVADRKNDEIAHLELGLRNVTLERSNDGYFVGANYPKNPQLAAQETDFDLKNMSVSGNARRVRWEQLMSEYKGRIGVTEAQNFLSDHYDTFDKKTQPSDRTLDGHVDLSPRGMGSWQPAYGPAGAVQNKVADTAMMERLSFSARAGHADGSTFKADEFLKLHSEYSWMKPYLRDMPSQPWTYFHATMLPQGQ